MIRFENPLTKKNLLFLADLIPLVLKRSQPQANEKLPTQENKPFTLTKSQYKSSPKDFIQNLAPYAIYTQQMTGIPASVTLAQAGLESGWGKHAPGNNFFGIKGEGPAGKQRLSTTEVRNGQKVRTQTWFRKYHDPFESFLDHAKVIAKGKYLKHAMEHTGSAREFVTALQSRKTKYATDPNYVKKVMNLINKYQLEKYDFKPMITLTQGVEK
jgi:flagellum-specific peptidoglycan hydrolase FlgJ